MNEEHFNRRTKRFALEVIAFCSQLPKGRAPDIMARQLVRAATSAAANYRAARPARSDQLMHARLSIVEEEADEREFGLELLVESGNATPARAEPLPREADEIVAMTVESKRTLKPRMGQPNRPTTIGNRQ